MSGHTRRFGLSGLQKGMLFHHLLDPHSGVDILQMTIDLLEPVDADLLEQSWNLVIARHEMLCAVFESRSGSDAVHVVGEASPIVIERRNYTDKSPAEFERAHKAYLRADRRRGFDLTQQPTIRLRLAKLGPKRHRFYWTHHHIQWDGWASLIVLDEVWKAYDALGAGQPVTFGPTVPFSQYIKSLESAELVGAEAFWKDKLSGLDAPTPLPVDPERPSSNDDRRYGEVEIRFSAEASERLATFAREQHVSLNILLQAAWALLLARNSSQQDALFGVTKSTRRSSQPETGLIVGPMLVTLPVRLATPSEMPVTEWLQYVHAEWVSLRPYEQVPLTDIGRWVPLGGSAGLFDSYVLFTGRTLEEDLATLGPRWENRKVRQYQHTNFGLSLLGNGGARFCIQLEYDGGRYTRATARRLLAQVEAILLAFESHRDRPLGKLAAMTEPEQKQVLVEWNATSNAYDAGVLVPDLVRHQAVRTPDAIAVRFEALSLTYHELDRRVTELAARLRTLGVGPSKLVGLGIKRSIEMVVGLLAVLRAGGAYVPLDPAFPSDRLEYMVEDSGLALLLTTRATGELLATSPVTRIYVEDEVEGDASTTVPEGLANPEDLAYVLYTSGSTGRPKGVQIEHRSLINFLHSVTREPGLTRSDVLLSVTTLSFDISGLEIMLPLINGAQLVVVSQDAATDGRELLESLERYRPTVMQATPATWRMLVASGLGKQPNLKALCGGESLPPELATELLARVGELWNMYGPTETTIWSTVKHVTTADAITIGRPIDNTTLYILDPELRPVPIGATGELFIGGDGVARGYLNRPELTAEKFISDPFVADARIYRTGDLARYRCDGQVECLDRADHQVKIRGFRIELGEIEANLENHEQVGQAVVDKRNEVLVAYVVPTGDGISADLRDFLQGKLPAYMVPSELVVMDALPLTLNNKVDRKALPSPHASGTEARIERPISDDERRMMAIWERILKRGAISVNDAFFDLGGDSLRAVSLLIAVEDEFGIRLPLSAIMETPTVEQLVTSLSVARPSGFITRLRGGSSGQAPMWLIPGAAGHSVAFRHLVARLPVDRTIYGLENPETEETADTSVEQIAEAYLRAIREQQPSGPYVFIGLCFGALLAFEMARQLKRDGETMEFLGLFDPSVPRAFVTPNTVRLIAQGHIGKLSKMGFTEIVAKLGRLGRNAVPSARTWLSYNLRPAAAPAPVRVAEDRQTAVVAELDRVRDTRIAIGTRYAPGTYQGHALLLISEQRGLSARIATHEGWRRCIDGQVVVHSVPGSHGDFFLAPHVDKLAQRIEEWFARGRMTIE